MGLRIGGLETAEESGDQMSDYISRDAAIDAVFGAMADGRAIFPALNNLPVADVQEVVRGEWETVYDDFMKSHYDTCSCCGKEYFGARCFNFCPNCGADMRESKQESKQVGIREGEANV